MDRKRLAKTIFDVAHITGEFLLRSGKISNEYFDKYQFESRPEILDVISTHLLGIIPDDTQMLAGLEMGGIPIATAISLKNTLPVVYVRKKAKEYGTRKIAEGAPFEGKKVLIVEDVVTTGGQIIESCEELRKLGAVIDSVICVIVRDPKAFDNLSAAGLKLIPLFTMEELKQA